jgi:hypothetical protein
MPLSSHRCCTENRPKVESCHHTSDAARISAENHKKAKHVGDSTARRDQEPWPTDAPPQARYSDIEARAQDLLSRALSIGRVVGFIGSGVSMSYGKASWPALFRGVAEWVTARTGQNSDLDKIMEATGGPEQYPLLFEISERAHADSVINKAKNDGFSLRDRLKK